MKLLEIMQGKWVGHPLHPAIVHVPVGAWMAACVLDLIAETRWLNVAAIERLALYCVVAGLIGALIAVPFGLADWITIKKGKPARRIGGYHMAINGVATLVWLANLALRLDAGGHRNTGGILATSVIATVLVLIGGYLGSLLVFDRGVSIARHSKPELRARAASGGVRLPEES